MRTAPMHDAYIRATLNNVAETTQSAQPLRMPPRLRRHNTLLALCIKAGAITTAVALVLYVAARIN